MRAFAIAQAASRSEPSDCSRPASASVVAATISRSWARSDGLPSTTRAAVVMSSTAPGSAVWATFATVKRRKAAIAEFAGRAVPDRGQRRGLELFESTAEEQVVLGREVVEHGGLGHLRGSRDLDHGDLVEPVRHEQLPRGRRDPLARLPLLPRPEPVHCLHSVSVMRLEWL